MASACNIRCFFNEHAAKSFTTDWLLIMISSGDMACFHPYVIHSRNVIVDHLYLYPVSDTLADDVMLAFVCVHKCEGAWHYPPGERGIYTHVLLKHGSAFQSPKLSLRIEIN